MPLYSQSHQTLIQELTEGNAEIIVIRGGRSGGKGTSTYVTDVMQAQSKPGTSIVYKSTVKGLRNGVVQQYKNCIALYERFIKDQFPLYELKEGKQFTYNKTTHEIGFKATQSRVLFSKLTERDDTAGIEAQLDSPLRYVVVDEAADIPHKKCFTDLMEAVMARGKLKPRVVFIFNPTVTGDSPVEEYLKETTAHVKHFQFNYDSNYFLSTEQIDYIHRIRDNNYKYYEFAYLGIGSIVNNKAFPSIVTFEDADRRAIDFFYVFDYGKADATAGIECAIFSDGSFDITDSYYRDNRARPMTITKHVDALIDHFDLRPEDGFEVMVDWGDLQTEFADRGFNAFYTKGKNLRRQYNRAYEMLLAGAARVFEGLSLLLAQLKNAKLDGHVVAKSKTSEDEYNDHLVDCVMYAANYLYKKWRKANG